MAASAQRMLDSVFRREGKSAHYTPPGGGASVPCRVLLTSGDQGWRGGDHAGTSTPARIAEIRVSEVPLVKEEGTLTLDASGETLTIQSAKRTDADRLLWRLELG